MKTQYLFILTISIVISLSCKRNTDINFNFPEKPVKTIFSANKDYKLVELLTSNAPKSESFTVNAATGGTVSTTKGSDYTIWPNSFIYQDGKPVIGQVDLIIKEVTQASEMILADKPTTTTDGNMLKSFGEFKVEAFQGQTPVLLQPKAVISVSVIMLRDSSAQTRQEVPMWDGDTVIQTSVSGRDFENKLLTLTFRKPLRKGIDWRANNLFATTNGSKLNFPIDKLGTWTNCDVLRPTSGATTFICYFNNVFNDSSDVSNLLFFKLKGENTLIKIYEYILNPPPGKSGFISYQNKFNIGLQGTVIGIVYKGGKFYATTKDVVIGNPAAGRNFFGVDLFLQEMTESQLLALISSMNTK